LSDEELDKIIRLRQIGASWLKIQRETGIHRQTAKRAYTRWEHSKSMEELKEARQDVAAQALREHIQSLIRLAGSLVTNLGVPSWHTDMQKDAKQFFSWLLEQDLLQRYISSETQAHVYTMGDTQCFYIGEDSQSYRREKELLLESLKVHTREEVRWGDVLDNRWKNARDNCAKIVTKLQKEASQVVNNFVNQERQGNLFLQTMKEAIREDDPIKWVAEAVLKEIWRATLQDKLDEEGPWFQTVSRRTGLPQDIDIDVMCRYERVLTFFGNTNKSLAEKVTQICNLAYNNLSKGDMVKQLRDEVHRMKRATEELREMLNPVKLTPLILRTRCDLCPA
jgi:hypothetical protein